MADRGPTRFSSSAAELNRNHSLVRCRLIAARVRHPAVLRRNSDQAVSRIAGRRRRRRRYWRRPAAATARPAARPARSPGSVTQHAAAASLLPAKIKTAGKLVVGVNPPYSPNEYKDASGKLVGFDVDLLDATAKVLGLTTDYQRGRLRQDHSGGHRRYLRRRHVVVHRHQGARGVGRLHHLLQRRHPVGLTAGKTVDPDNACGLKVSVQTTTTEDTDDVPARSKACTTPASRPSEDPVRQPGRRHQRGHPRQGRRDVGRLAGHGVRDQAERRQAAGRRRRSTSRRPTAGRSPRARRWPRPCRRPLQSLIDNGTYLTRSARSGACSPARSRRRRSTAPRADDDVDGSTGAGRRLRADRGRSAAATRTMGRRERRS